jgi:predicted RNA-binding protein with PUA-like domain
MKNYWLLKTEPTEYSIADLERDGTTRWTGVSNPLARKYLRAMRSGDEVMIYHTGKEKQIVGLARVVEPGEEPVLRAAGRLSRSVTLAEVKAHKRFADWELVRMGRLSVMPVSPPRWELVLQMAQP